MSEIQRYSLYVDRGPGGSYGMGEDADGRWVKYVEHTNEVDRLTKHLLGADQEYETQLAAAGRTFRIQTARIVKLE